VFVGGQTKIQTVVSFLKFDRRFIYDTHPDRKRILVFHPDPYRIFFPVGKFIPYDTLCTACLSESIQQGDIHNDESPSASQSPDYPRIYPRKYEGQQ
jgi:hypothetical protein